MIRRSYCGEVARDKRASAVFAAEIGRSSTARFKTRASRTRPSGAVESLAKGVSFFTSHFEIEHQVLDIETKLGERFLNKRQNPATTTHDRAKPIQAVVTSMVSE